MRKTVVVLSFFVVFVTVISFLFAVCKNNHKEKLDIEHTIGFIREYGLSSKDFIDVTFEDLKTNGSKYHMQNIRIQGVSSYAIEDQVLYKTFNSYNIRNSSKRYDGFWLNFSKNTLKEFGGKTELVDIRGKEIIIEGRYDNTPVDFATNYLGEIDNISFIGILP